MDLINRYKRLFLAFGVIICIAGIIISITGVVPTYVLGRTLGHVVIPMQRGASSITGWVDTRITMLTQSGELLREIQALREENTRLHIENQRIPLLESENEDILFALDMVARYPELDLIGANMIGQNPNQWQSRFNIDRGENHGILPNMVVYGDGGVLGVIIQTGANYALVASIMDNSFAAAVRNSRTEDVGVVRGDIDLRYDGLMRMEYISSTARFMPGDEIITSADGAFFPPGLLVGTVESIHPTPGAGGLTQYAIIRPAANLDRISLVLVVNQVFEHTHRVDVDEE